MCKVSITVTIKLIIEAKDTIDIEEVLEEMDYNFESNTENANIVNNEIQDWNIIDPE